MLNSFKNNTRGKYTAKLFSLQYINNWMVRNKISESVMCFVSVSNYETGAMRTVLQRLEGWGFLFSVYLHKLGSYIGLIEGPVDPSLAKITPFDNAVAVSTVSSQVGISGLSGLSSEAMLLFPPHLGNFFMWTSCSSLQPARKVMSSSGDAERSLRCCSSGPSWLGTGRYWARDDGTAAAVRRRQAVALWGWTLLVKFQRYKVLEA